MVHLRPDTKGFLERMRLRAPSKAQEDGFVLAFCTIFITVLLGLGGFTVDIGNWYIHALRLQRAADAASLAGSVYLPNDPAGAESAARSSLQKNNASSLEVSIEQSSLHPSQLEVKVTEKINNYFTSLIGYDSITLTRSAYAEYRPYVPMGSPSNVLGVEYNSSDKWEKDSTQGMQNSYWLTMAGPGDNKVNGDRFSSGQCANTTSNCDALLPIPKRNLDYVEDGQIYVVRIPNNISGVLSVQAFDPVFASVGNHCELSTLSGASAYNSLYARNDTPQCTGDWQETSSATPPNTTFTMYTPELSADGTKPVTTAGCTEKSFEGYKGNISAKVNPAASTYDPAFVAAFRKWTTICQMYVDGSTAGGDYLLHIKSGPEGTIGLNRFALRVAIITGSGTVDTTKTSYLQVFSKGRLVVYARESAANVNFYLARIGSSAAGRTMIVTLFDIGDATGTSTLQLLPADDARVGNSPMSTYSGCQYTPPKSTVYQATSGNCRITGVTNSVYNGQIVNIKVKIPDNYTCNDADVNGCWTRLAVNYSASVNDNTSWQVSLDGNPVHLVVN